MTTLAALALAFAADWLSAHERTQPEERAISAATAPNLKLLWKLPLGEPITAPVVLGPIFTHRGIKELVFVAGASDTLYAVDADLSRLVWKRHFDVTPSAECRTGLTAAPVLAPYYGPLPEGDDASTPRRSLFVLTSDGRLHTVRPADGGDLTVPLDFVPPGSVARDLTLHRNVISTYIASGCAAPEPGEWSLTLNPGAKAAVQPGKPEPLQPVQGNGLRFQIVGSALHVTEAGTGREVYVSPENGNEAVVNSLAVANGHVYFVAGRTLFCFGFPLEI